MASCGISSVKSRKSSQGICTALASAGLEWLLICMLFIDAIFSYLITTFACHFELQLPCLLCSRLDHIWGNKRLKYYWDLFCNNHKLEISSLIFCHSHNKLVDVHDICESCLFSFATINKSNAETYRLLVAKLGDDSSFSLDEDPLLDGHVSSSRYCSCCNQPWISRGNGQRLMQTKSIGSEAVDLDVPLSGVVGHGGKNLKKSKRSVSVRAVDHLTHVRYSELKIDSDTESNNSDDDADVLIRELQLKEDDGIESVLAEPRIVTVPDDSASDKLIDPVSASDPSVSLSQVQSILIEPHGVTPTPAIGHGLEELDWQQANSKAHSSAVPELISLAELSLSSTPKETMLEASKEIEFNSSNDVPPLSNAGETSVESSEESSKFISADDVPPLSYARETHVQRINENAINSIDDCLPSSDAGEILAESSKEKEPISVDDSPPSSDTREHPFGESEEHKSVSIEDVLPSSHAIETLSEISNDMKLASLVDVLPSANGAETPVQGLEDSCLARTDEACETAVTHGKEVCEPASELAGETETVTGTNAVSSDPQVPNLLDLGDAYKLAVSNRSRQLSGVLAEQWLGKDSSRVSEDLKLLLSQLSAAREQSINGASPRLPMSPKLSLNSDEFKNTDASSSIGMQILQKRISLDRNLSGQSLDGSIVSEIEGESPVDRLKRQVEHDKKLLSALYKELEEERNASAVAANQAMAMITRLQEEKATLHMEALQCLRMMEEQAEYDMESLEKSNDLLAEKEKEIQDLEAELEFYRSKLPNESMLLEDAVGQIKATSGVEDSEIIHRNTISEKLDRTNSMNSSLLEFEDEKSYILRSLKKLERKLSFISNNGLPINLGHGEYSSNEGDRVNESNELNGRPGFQHQGGVEDNDLSMQNDTGSEPAQGQVSPLEKTEFTSSALPTGPGMIDIDSLTNEVSDLTKRLEVLETDLIFLEHAVNSIRSGEEGLQFIQEIACHLKELRRIVIRRRTKCTA